MSLLALLLGLGDFSSSQHLHLLAQHKGQEVSVCIGSVRDCERSLVLSLYLVEPVATFLHNGFGI